MLENKVFTKGRQSYPSRLVGFQLPEYLDMLLEDLAQSLDRNKGSLLREAVRYLLEKYADKLGVEMEMEMESK